MILDKRLDEMITGLKPYAEAKFGIKINEFSSKDLYAALLELKDRRESDLRPAIKFVASNTISDQIVHVRSEYFEVENEFREILFNCPGADVNKLAEELIDLQTSCETMLAIIGFDEQKRHEMRKVVIAKNAYRGYYNRRVMATGDNMGVR